MRYRFRDGVRFQADGGKHFLVSNYPLKAVRLSPGIRPVFARLAERGDTALEELRCLLPREQADGLEVFLGRLVDRGFLEESGHGARDDAPMISIVIPVRNRPDDIACCLASLTALDYPEAGIETIVVDDGSTDETPEIIARFGVKLLRVKERHGASFCRNFGAGQARGDILVFLDSDCTVKEDWGWEVAAAFRDPEVAACGCLVDSREDRRGLDRYEQVKSSLMMGRMRRDSRDGGRFFYTPSCSLAVRKDRFSALGGFREDLDVGEDVDLCWRLVDGGGVIAYRPSAVVYHRHRNLVRDFCSRRFDYGTSEPLLQRLHPSRRKEFILWPKALAFWTLVAAAFMWGQPGFLAAALAFLLGDALWSRKKALRSGLGLPLLTVLSAVSRVNLSFLYHVCAFVSRYYLLPAMAAGFIWPGIALALAVGHGAVGLVQYAIHQPRLTPASFLFYFTLEQVSYQAGVWWGCIKQLFWGPVLPRLRFRVAGDENL